MDTPKFEVPKSEWDIDRWGAHTKRIGRIGFVTVTWTTKHLEGGGTQRGWQVVVFGQKVIEMPTDLTEALALADKWTTRLLNEALESIS